LLKILAGTDGVVEVTDAGGLAVSYKSINEKIHRLYEDHAYEDDAWGLASKDSQKQRKQRAKLIEVLEHREALHALENLFAHYTPHGHLFRTISVSDLIVFHALMAIEKRGHAIDGIDEHYRPFCSIVFDHGKTILDILGKRIDIHSFNEYYDRLHKEQDEEDIRNLCKAFGWIHSLSNRIKDRFREVAPEIYTGILQDFGDNIRKCGDPFGSSVQVDPECAAQLAKDIAHMVTLLYKGQMGAFFVIDCLRNPYEAIYLRNELANFFLVSLFEHTEARRKRYLQKARERWGAGYEEQKALKAFKEADRRDSGSYIDNAGELLYKQNVTKCVQISDIAINNFSQGDDERRRYKLYRKILRVTCLILSPGCTKPSKDEVFMNLAYTVAVKSNCISRQVGAVIVGPEGYVVGVGWNDATHPRVSCGLTAICDLEASPLQPLMEAIKKDDEDAADVMKRLCKPYEASNGRYDAGNFCFCFKDEMAKKDIAPRLQRAWIRKLEQMLATDTQLGRAARSDPQVMNKMKTGMGQLIGELVEEGHLHQLEYCLALHAEENAILQSAKIGGTGLQGATIYTTALPCTLCAKMIQQVGIKKVVYTEPYPKALTRIYINSQPVQFEGVKPRAYVRLFMPDHDQKEWQELQARSLVPSV
jgi:deoxycytidylate deaminase